MRLATRLLAILVRTRPPLRTADDRLVPGRHPALRNPLRRTRDMARCRTIEPRLAKDNSAESISFLSTVPDWLPELEHSTAGTPAAGRRWDHFLPLYDSRTEALLLAEHRNSELWQLPTAGGS